MSRVLFACVFLLIGLPLAQAQAENGGDLVHRVSAGDTLISIAHAYGVTLDHLVDLNGLDPAALLQIDQRLVVIRAGDAASDDGEPEGDDAGQAATANAPVAEAGEWPPAPVLDADAPMRNPADLSARLCSAVFHDMNQNGLMEPDEQLLPEATIRLLDAAGDLRFEYKTDGRNEPFCSDQLERQLYSLEAMAPPGFGLTSAPSLRLDLRTGGLARVDFGAMPGLELAALPPSDLPPALQERVAETGRSFLRELSGLFVLGLAAVVFLSGMAVSLFLRSR